MYSVVLMYHSAFDCEAVSDICWSDMDCKILMTTVTTKEEIVKILKIKPDMIFICTKEDDTDVFEIADELINSMPYTVVSFISSNLEFDFVKKAMNIGVTRYISLPIEEHDFRDCVDAMKHRVLELKKTVRGRKGRVVIPEQKSEDVNSFAVRRAMAYIEANYKKKIALQDVAEDIYISKWHLSKLLNQYAGRSFTDIVNGYRIEDAKVLLRNPTLKLSTIAETVGLKDGAHFSHVFKRMTGMTPVEYKNSVMETEPDRQ